MMSWPTLRPMPAAGRAVARRSTSARRILVAALALTARGWIPGPSTVDAAKGGYRLPAPKGTTLTVTQGNNVGEHVGPERYAFDFTARRGGFRVLAARSGVVAGMRNFSVETCWDGGADWSCWQAANYVLIRHDDGTSDLYLHFKIWSILVVEGQRVVQGQYLGTAGNVGYASGTHLHFQRQKTAARGDRDYPGWWYRKSVPVSFRDADVRKQSPSGVPATGKKYVSSNTQAKHVPRVTWTGGDGLVAMATECGPAADGAGVGGCVAPEGGAVPGSTLARASEGPDPPAAEAGFT